LQSANEDLGQATTFLRVFKAKTKQLFQKPTDFHYQSNLIATARSPS
jgi:hypothetical protein